MYQFFKRALGRPSYSTNENGGVTVEFVILFPALLVLAGAAMDFGFTYFKHSQIQAAVQDVTRARSIGTIPSNSQAATVLANRLAQGFSDEAQVSVSMDGPMLSTSVRVPLHDLQLVGFFTGLIGDPTIEVGDQQFFESFDIAASNDGSMPGNDTDMVDGILNDGVSQ